MNKILRRVLLGLGGLLLLLVFLVVGAVLARDRIALAAIHKAVAKTGFGLEIQHLHLTLAPLGLEVAGVKLTNPPDFPEPRALEITKLKLTYDRSASTKEETRLPEVTIDLPSLVVVRKPDGEVNFQRFQKQAKGPAAVGGGAPAPQPPAEPAPQPAPEKKVQRKLRVDHLNIRLGTVLVRTYVQGEPEPHEQKFEMNVDKQYTDVTNDNIKQIITQLMLEIMFKRPPEAVLGDLLSGKPGAADQVKDSAKQFGNQLKGLLQSIKQQQQPRP